jgi:S1-C subfamily serine protease
LIVTNWHVVSDWMGALLNEGGYAAIYLTVDPDQPPAFTYWAQVLPGYSDEDLDLAVLQITHRAADSTPVFGSLGLPAIPLGDSALVHRGDHVILLGFPDYVGGSLSWTEGAVATCDSSWIKSDAESSHDHSGGMMLNERGELIGVLTQYETTSVGGGLSVARPVERWRGTFCCPAR